MTWRVIEGDATVVVPTLRLGDAGVHVVTDPPYGIGLQYGDTADNWRPGADFWRDLRSVCPTGSTLHMTVSNAHLAEWMREVTAAGWQYYHCSVYWNKRRAGGNANGRFAFAWEPLLSFVRDEGQTITLPKRMLSDVFPHTGKTETDHPAERDLGAWRLFMSHLPEGLILDPFAGSGTTLRAAIDLGRDVVGIERENQWVEQITYRCSQESLFSGDMSRPRIDVVELMTGEGDS